MNILCDLDGVLCNTSRRLNAVIKELYNIGPGDVPYTGTHYRIEEEYPQLSEKDVERIFSSETFWESLDSFQLAENFTKQLLEFGEVHIVTARNNSLYGITESWLKLHNIEYTTLTLTKAEDKKDYCKSNNINLVIEDRPRNIRQISKVCTTIGIYWPYNVGKVQVPLKPTYKQAINWIINNFITPVNSPIIKQSSVPICQQ
jgi:uncharacterized HAD superfamily protein